MEQTLRRRAGKSRPLLSLSAAFLAATLAAAALMATGAEAGILPPKPLAPESELMQIRSQPLPAHCLMQVGPRRNPVAVMPERCLQQAGVRARLPRHCAQPARIAGPRPERVYALHCLREAGFHIAQPRNSSRDPWGNDPRRPLPPRF